MIIQQLKESGIEVFPDKGENAYKVILDHPGWCTRCGMSVVSVGFSKPRTFMEMYDGAPREVTLRCSRYRCSNKQCNTYAYTGRENPVSLFINVGEKISLEVKLSAVRQKLREPSLPTEEICNKYKISHSTLRKALSCLYDKAEAMKSGLIAACDYLVFWPLIYKGRTRACLFGVDSTKHKIGLVDILPENEMALFLRDYVLENDGNDLSSKPCNIILKMNDSVFWNLRDVSKFFAITVTEEDYDDLEKKVTTMLSPKHMERLGEIKANGSIDQNQLNLLLEELSEEEIGIYGMNISTLKLYVKLIRNSVEFDKSYIENTLNTMKTMWDNHLSDREILLHFVFKGTFLRDQLKRTGFGCYISE